MDPEATVLCDISRLRKTNIASYPPHEKQYIYIGTNIRKLERTWMFFQAREDEKRVMTDI